MAYCFRINIYEVKINAKEYFVNINRKFSTACNNGTHMSSVYKMYHLIYMYYQKQFIKRYLCLFFICFNKIKQVLRIFMGLFKTDNLEISISVSQRYTIIISQCLLVSAVRLTLIRILVHIEFY